ncbi:uncharacterized protein LOC126909495 [Daktulosphaira vitifoliae]|uniref:uncharacterized protein LOC126909495 n=1 Tax=Daktulosphaira vitifoliae TaxID=58002 RepID=UPI0021AA58CB|nr:uncharacterized protein LOC126909495 [Daktulosphaira vitifoliae]XP_050547882.1 uncharacterized protein LOC126909495 [Daktulosphaira vitifoliae]
MFRECLMILLAFLVALSLENEECTICSESVSEFNTMEPCQHKICYICVTKIMSSSNSTCPLCRRNFLWTKGAKTHEEELSILKVAVMDKSITVEKIISYFYILPPWQYADDQMLDDIGEIKDSYPSEDISMLIDFIRNGCFNYTIEEDVEQRRKYFRKEPNDEEKIILQNYYIRNDLNVQNEFNARKIMF